MLVDCKRREDRDRADVFWKRKSEVEIPTIGDDLTSFGRRFVRVFRTPALGSDEVVNRMSKHLQFFAGVSGLDFDQVLMVYSRFAGSTVMVRLLVESTIQ